MTKEIGKKCRIMMVPLMTLFLLLLFIHPVNAIYFGPYLIQGKVLNTDSNNIVCAAKAYLFQAPIKPVYYPWNGYSSSGWRVIPYGECPPLTMGSFVEDYSKCKVWSGKTGFGFQQTISPSENLPPRYWYVHVDPPTGYRSVSAKSLDSFGYGTVIDNQTIFYDAYELPPKRYEVEFRVAPIPPTQWWAGEICDDKIGVREFYEKEDTAPSTALEECKKDPPIIASFSQSVKSGSPPLTVQFGDTSTGPVDKWSWDFGDRSTSKDKNPLHIYQDPGTYPVTLTVRHDDCPTVAGKHEPSAVIVYLQEKMDDRSINNQAEANIGELDKLPCITGGKRCGEMCVDLLADPNNCGACARICSSGETCENGQCILRVRDMPENKAWYDIFLSIPGTLMSFIQGSPAPGTQTTGSVQTAGSVSVIDIPEGSTADAQAGSMHVVVLPDSDEQRTETIQDADKIIPPPPALSEPQVVIIQEHMIAGTVEIPTVTTSPEPRAIIPENYIGSKPQIVPIKFTCPSGYISCNGQCVDLMTDTANCGSCNSTCPSQFTCVGGMCTSQCNSGQTLCNGACVNLQTDPANCGTCGNVCTNGAACENGQCVLPMVKIQPTRLGDIGKVRF